MPAIIPDLPKPLRTVPTDRDQWELWAAAVTEYRLIVWDRCERDAAFRADIRKLCAADKAYFLTIFGFIFEPRTRPGIPAGVKPFIPFAYQVEIIRWHSARMQDLEDPDGFLPKPRGLGVSWTICAGRATWPGRSWPTSGTR